MSQILNAALLRGGFAFALVLPTAWVVAAQVTDVSPVHDPCLIRQGDVYYLFSTGTGIPVRKSIDLIHWARAGEVMSGLPAWAKAAHPTARNPWAPDISFSHKEFRLYYTVSTFGSTDSTIGLATNPTLDPAAASFHWTDCGPIYHTHAHDTWNAIDAAAFTDSDGHCWLATGSFWGGIKLLKLDPTTGKVIDGDLPRSIAVRPGDGAIEAPFLSLHEGWYYLWASFDYCCRGVRSTYNTRVGRSRSVEGPYVDRDGKPMTEGGGTIVLTSDGDMCGPGHCAVLADKDGDILVHHWYDAAHHGRPTLGVHRLQWDADGWPHAGPLLTSSTQPSTAP